MPVPVIVPLLALQVTAALLLLATVAVTDCAAPVITVNDCGERLTLTVGGGGGGAVTVTVALATFAVFCTLVALTVYVPAVAGAV